MTDAKPALTLSVEKNIATITLCRPEKLNALSADAYYHLSQVLRQVAEMSEVTITILTGTGRYFSAGADVTAGFTAASRGFAGVSGGGAGLENASLGAERRGWFKTFAANNIDVTRAFFQHPKILVIALNGPAIGLSAALVAFADFVYASPTTFLMTPFSSLGLVAEGGASYMFVKRMGIAKANEALIQSKRITIEELVQCGFVNKVFEGKGEGGFIGEVKKYVDDVMGSHLNHESMIQIKKLVQEGMERDLEAANVREAVMGVERFAKGVPQEEFGKIASGQKRHKL